MWIILGVLPLIVLKLFSVVHYAKNYANILTGANSGVGGLINYTTLLSAFSMHPDKLLIHIVLI